MTSNTSSPGDAARLNSQIEELNKKLDSLNTKLEKNEADSAQLMQQSQTMLAATSAARAQEIMRQTVSNPSSFIAVEATNFIIQYLQKYQTTKFRTMAVARGRKVLERIISTYISQRVPMLNWYGTSVSAAGGNQYHLTTKTNFPVQVNTGVPFLGNVSIAKVIMEVQSDVNTTTNQMSNVKCNLSTDEAQRQLVKDLQEEVENTLKPHKTLWSILYPIGKGIRAIYRFLKRELSFSIPLLILFIITAFITPGLFPAKQIWTTLGNLVIFTRYLGISPLALLFGLINGIIWGALIWLIIRFNVIPGLGKLMNFISTKIFPPVRAFFRRPLYRYATILGVVLIIVLVVLWRVGVFSPPPPLEFSGINPPNSFAGAAYTADLTITGGEKPYTWSVVADSLPAGLTLDPAAGIISGSSTTAGAYTVSVQVKDSSKNGTTVTKDFRLVMAVPGNFIISSTSLPMGEIGKAYTTNIVAQGGATPYMWGISSGQLPPGLILSATGELSGVPTTRGDFIFTIVANGSSSSTMSFSQGFTLHIE
jgi:hypothetical protein